MRTSDKLAADLRAGAVWADWAALPTHLFEVSYGLFLGLKRLEKFQYPHVSSFNQPSSRATR